MIRRPPTCALFPSLPPFLSRLLHLLLLGFGDLLGLQRLGGIFALAGVSETANSDRRSGVGCRMIRARTFGSNPKDKSADAENCGHRSQDQTRERSLPWLFCFVVWERASKKQQMFTIGRTSNVIGGPCPVWW